MERLRHIRERAGYSQQALADESGVGQHTISEVELGRRKPHGRTLRKLAGVLGVQVADFYAETDTPKAEAPPSQRTLFNGVVEERREATIENAARGLLAIVEPAEAKLSAGAFTDEDRRELDRSAALITPLLQVALEAEAGHLREQHPDVYDVGPYAVLGPVIARFVAVVFDAGGVEPEAERTVRDLEEHRRTAYLAAA